MKIKIIFVALLIALSRCTLFENCEKYMNGFAIENKLSPENIHHNGQGFWWVEKDGEQLTNCLDKGGRATIFLPIKTGSCRDMWIEFKQLVI